MKWWWWFCGFFGSNSEFPKNVTYFIFHHSIWVFFCYFFLNRAIPFCFRNTSWVLAFWSQLSRFFLNFGVLFSISAFHSELWRFTLTSIYLEFGSTLALDSQFRRFILNFGVLFSTLAFHYIREEFGVSFSIWPGKSWILNKEQQVYICSMRRCQK